MLALRSIFDRDKFRKAESVQDGEEQDLFELYTKFQDIRECYLLFQALDNPWDSASIGTEKTSSQRHISLTTSAVKILR